MMIVTGDIVGRVYLDGDIINPHADTLAGMTAYYIDTKADRALEAAMTDADQAYKSAARSHVTYTFKCNNGGDFRVYHASGWSDNDTPELVTKDIEHMRLAANEAGLDLAGTAASLAGRITRANADTRQLPPRWRELAHGAINQGPMVCAMGGAPMVTAWDRKAAFLGALYKPVPTEWTALPPSALMMARRMRGIARATLHVEPSLYAGRIPPMPVRLHGYTIYPVGFVRGTWTLEMIFDAIDNGGYTLVECHELAVSKCEPIHARAAEVIEQIEDKRLRKALYTRYWGRMAAHGGYEGYTQPRYGRSKKFLGSRLKWYYFGLSPTSRTAPPDYRPDHSAFIASDNHLAMNVALRKYGQDEVIATHIDCLWTNTDTNPGGTFAVKHKGECRFYGVGTYIVGEALAAQGLDGEMKRESVAAWGAKLNPGNGIYRTWLFEFPNETASATSDPVTHSRAVASYEPVRNLPGDIYWHGWTKRGWLSDEAQTEDTHGKDSP